MDHRITQCPRCSTSFRVTDAQLAVAAGAVRCGSCLHIFNARAHWVEAAPVSDTGPTLRDPSAPRVSDPGPGPDFDIDDDLLIDDDTPLFGDDEEEPVTGVIFNPADTDFAEDGEELTDNDELTDDTGDLLIDNVIDTVDWEPEAHAALFSELDDIDPGLDDSPADERWAELLLEEETADSYEAPPQPVIFEENDHTPPGSPGTPPGDELRAEPPSPAGIPTEPRKPEAGTVQAVLEERPATPDPAPPQEELIAPEPLHPGERIGSGRSLLGEFEPEPLQLHTMARKPLLPTVAWGLATLAGVLLLAGQYLYFNFDRLARGELRPWLAEVCSALGCRVPPLQDLSQIRTSSLIVRSHPTTRGALAVDAILTNLAPFSQPYPALQLQFTDLEGRPVAGRRFLPGEYLGGELSGAEMMPVQQPVHIALEVVDPGPSAVNYLLTVAPRTDGN